MIHVTERAREMIKETLDDVLEEPELVLRLGPISSALALYLDSQNDDDEVIEHEGRAVLLVSRELSAELGGAAIDVEEAADGSHIVLLR